MAFVQTKLPCPACGGSDPVGLNEDGSAFCFSCHTRFDNYSTAEVQTKKRKPTPMSNKTDSNNNNNNKTFSALSDRGIFKETAKKYGVEVSTDFNGNIDRHYYPYYNGGSLESTKIRKVLEKDFYWIGEATKTDLFGQNLFPKGGKYLTITEGELDALAAHQMQGSKYPVVSVRSSSCALKDCKRSFDWIDSFETVVICFDEDDAGRKAALEVADLFGGKSMIVKHPSGFNDACDYLKANKQSVFIDSWWRAEKYVPDSIVFSNTLRDEVMADIELPFCSYPWDCLNLMAYGLRKGELITLTAGTGIGKSTVVKQIQEEIYRSTSEKIGVLSLEESVPTAALSLMSLSANKPLHLPTKDQMVKYILKDPLNITRKPKLADSITAEEKGKAFDDILESGRFLFMKHTGRQGVDSVLNRMRYMAKAEDCGVIVLDHISILVGMAQSGRGTEREAIDEVMHTLTSFVVETGISLIAISHLSKTGSGRDPHEEGGRVRLGDLRGSNAIAQLSNIAIGLEGNRQAEDPEEQNMTVVRVLKNRYSGETGVAGYLKYDSTTGRLNEVDDYEARGEL